jgi:hypothetical protein
MQKAYYIGFFLKLYQGRNPILMISILPGIIRMFMAVQPAGFKEEGIPCQFQD